MDTKKKFTVADGITIQDEHLANWKRLLKQSVYIDLEVWARKDNHLAEDGYGIARGVSLDNFIGNYTNHHKKK